jgi:alpha-N-arabinofuranosidase
MGKSVSGSIITSASIADHNTFDKGNTVGINRFNDAVVTGAKVMVTLPPKSVVTLELV